MSTKVASLYAEIGADTTGFEQGSKKVKSGLQGMQGSIRDFIPPSLASFLSLSGAVTGVALAIKGALDETIKYANDVRTLSQLSGESTEESSRFIQVLDDYKISAADALVATRALTKEGYTPSIETLAKLSDQYLALNSVEAKNEFVLKNLGRGGLQWVEVLNKGSKAIREQGAAIDENLILTQAMVDEARRAEVATDGWNDTIAALKTQFAAGLLPHLTDYLNKLRAATASVKENGYWTTVFHPSLRKAALAEIEAADATIVHTDALESNTASLQENEEQIKAREEAAKALSDSLSDQIGLINSIQAAEESYTEKSNNLANDRKEKEAELAKLRAQGYWEQSDQIQGALSDLEEIKQAEADLAAEREKQTLQFISDLLAQNLARDGWTQAEFNAFAKQQQAWGLWSADVVAKAQRAWQEADRVTASINAIPSSKVSNISVVTSYYTGSTGQGSGGAGTIKTQHAEGGSFVVPQSYGNEGFPMGGGDTASAGERITITPKGKEAIDYKKLTRAIRDGMAQVGA